MWMRMQKCHFLACDKMANFQGFLEFPARAANIKQASLGTCANNQCNHFQQNLQYMPDVLNIMVGVFSNLMSHPLCS